MTLKHSVVCDVIIIIIAVIVSIFTMYCDYCRQNAWYILCGRMVIVVLFYTAVR